MKKYAKIKRLFKTSVSANRVGASQVDESMKALSHLLKRGKEIGRFQIKISDKRKVSHYCLDLLSGECRLGKTTMSDTHFAVATSKETWAEIAAGDLSPVDAFLTGRMEVEGDLSFGKRLYAKAASKPGSIEFTE
jgi:putative sterol carrier protein